MIGAFFNALVTFVIQIIQVILSPLDTLITNNIPELSNILSFISAVIDYIISYIGFAIDVVGLTDTAIALIVAYWSFALTVPIAAWVIKFAVKWWHALMP